MSTSPPAGLAWLVGRDVTRTFGGGMAAIEMLRRSFTSRGWIDPQTHEIAVAVSRLTPGTNILAYCTGIGWRLGGARGSAVALLAASLPSAALILMLSMTVVRLDRYRSVQVALAMGAIVAAALLFSAAWHLLRPYVHRDSLWRTFAVAVPAFALSVAGVTPVRILMLSAFSGWLIAPRSRV